MSQRVGEANLDDLDLIEALQLIEEHLGVRLQHSEIADCASLQTSWLCWSGPDHDELVRDFSILHRI